MTQHQRHATGEFREIADLSETERHRLLAAERRRILLTIISSHSSPLDLETAAKKVAERDSVVSRVDSATVDRMKSALHHTHIPLLSDMGIVESNTDANQIEFAENWTY